MSLQQLPLAAAGKGEKSRHRTWDENYAELLKFHAQTGHSQVPMRWKEDPILGKWCSHNREYFLSGQLSQERIESLEAVDFVWSPHEKKWNDQFKKMVAFHKTHGHTKIKCHHAEDPSLGKWVARQREDYQMGRMNPQRKKKLDSIGFTFRITKGHKNKGGNAKTEAAWQRMYDQLLQFKEKHGHVNVPRLDADPNPLEKWVGAQRLKHTRDQLSKERVQKLESVGFIWKFQAKKSQEEWNKMFNMLKQCQIVREDGNSSFQPSLLGGTDASSLSRWIQRQKEKYKSHKLEVGRELLLRRLNFNFPERPPAPPAKKEDDEVLPNDSILMGDMGSNDNQKTEGTSQLLDAKPPASDNTVGQTVAESIRVLSKHMGMTPNQLTAKLAGNGHTDERAANPPPNKSNAFRRLMPLIVQLRDCTDEAVLRDCATFLARMVQRAKSNSSNEQAPLPDDNGDDDYYNLLLELAVDLDACGGDNGAIEACAIYFERYLKHASSGEKRSAVDLGGAESGFSNRPSKVAKFAGAMNTTTPLYL
ncbi:helicase [Seminavis robusta]|uniref:Helicase n=1 Tax=Seminavis robusta TaxID=568900 RepID=A0A9N8E1R2_9STRA|nr:helicase [Seminavis robusta]|eukprot:Sro529_g161100.1 helicase (533) ;mRNA; r:51991-53808